ncbi:MAG: proton-conducting transporter membrane subunit, partial [Anaerolineaceae bacterium]|nr:proton-conducting transporter membrane subunit [Anaerolineaceae bacterium]
VAARDGLIGAGMQMFSHGVMTALFFAIVGMVYDRTHNRDISKLGGLYKKMPWAAIGFIIGGLVSMGMPGFSGFTAEFPIFMGVWATAPVFAIIAVLGVIITAAYIFRVTSRVFFGELPAEYGQTVGDIGALDKAVIALLSVVMISLGLFPMLMTPWVQSGVDNVLRLLGGA